MAAATSSFVHSYPNAGLPNAMGGYDDTPDMFATAVKQCAAKFSLSLAPLPT